MSSEMVGGTDEGRRRERFFPERKEFLGGESNAGLKDCSGVADRDLDEEAGTSCTA